MLVLLENNLNVLKGRIFKCVFKGYYRLLLLLFFKFFTAYNDGTFKS